MAVPADQQPNRVRLDGADWTQLFPFLHLFKSFRMAMQPGKLLLALLLVVLLYLGGHAMDLMWGRQVVPQEVQAWMLLDSESYQAFVHESRQVTSRGERAAIFQTIMAFAVDSFAMTISGVTDLQLGFRDLLAGQVFESASVLGGLSRMLVVLPGWLLSSHPGFLALYLFLAFLLVALLGGAITRQAALEACCGRQISASSALGYIARRYHWVVLTVIIPLLLVVALAAAAAVAGLVLFNLPWLEILGGLLFPLLLLLGLLATLLLLALGVSVGSLMPAVAVDNTDAFDAISRSFHYCVGRLGRWFSYHVVILIYGALTYMLIGMVIFLTLWLTKYFANLLVLREALQGASRLDVILPDPRLGELIYDVAWDQMTTSSRIAAALVMVWTKLLVFLLPAYAISYYLCAQTWVYLLLRRAADTIGFEQCHLPGADVNADADAPTDAVSPMSKD